MVLEGIFYFLAFVENQNMKKSIVFGVEMTSLEEMMFGKHLSNNGIAMNTLYPIQRTELTKQWIEKYRTNA